MVWMAFLLLDDFLMPVLASYRWHGETLCLRLSFSSMITWLRMSLLDGFSFDWWIICLLRSIPPILLI